jgi:hypothetical protein
MSMTGRVLLGLLGVILLLPGLCSLVSMFVFGGTVGVSDSPIVLMWLVTFAIAWGGYVLLRKARRG